MIIDHVVLLYKNSKLFRLTYKRPPTMKISKTTNNKPEQFGGRNTLTLISVRSVIHLAIVSAEKPTLGKSRLSSAFGFPLRPKIINCGADAVFNLKNLTERQRLGHIQESNNYITKRIQVIFRCVFKRYFGLPCFRTEVHHRTSRTFTSFCGNYLRKSHFRR